MTPKKQYFNLNNADLSPLPFSETIEQDVLNVMLSEPDKFYPIGLKYLKAKGMFYGSFNNEIWQVMASVSKDKQLTVSAVFAVFDGLRDSEKSNHLLCICKYRSLPSDFFNNCLLLNEFWVKRTIHRMGFFLNQNALGEMDALDLLGICSDGTDKIYRHIAQMNETTISNGIQDLENELDEISKSPDGMLGMAGSIKGLNNVIKGYRKGNLIGLAGTTGEGKTTLECQEIRFFLEKNIPVGCFSLEMKTAELLLIMSCDAAGVKIEDVLANTAGVDNMQKVYSYMGQLNKMPLKINDRGAIKIGELKSIARMWVKNSGIKILFIDHVHLMEADAPGQNSEQKFTDIANQLKALAKELDIPIIALLQLSRKEKGSKLMHVNSDIKYAGGIEQACDIVLLIYRPEIHDIMYLPDGSSSKDIALIVIGKLRLLPRRNIKCHFSGTRFTDYNEWVYGQKEKPEISETGNIGKPNAGFQHRTSKDINYQIESASTQEEAPF